VNGSCERVHPLCGEIVVTPRAASSARLFSLFFSSPLIDNARARLSGSPERTLQRTHLLRGSLDRAHPDRFIEIGEAGRFLRPFPSRESYRRRMLDPLDSQISLHSRFTLPKSLGRARADRERERERERELGRVASGRTSWKVIDEPFRVCRGITRA